MAVRHADAVVEIEADIIRRPGGLAPVPDGPAAGGPCRHTDALVILTAIAERLADLDLDGMMAGISDLLDSAAALVSRDGAILAGDLFALPSPDRLRGATRAVATGRGQQPFEDTILPVRDASGAVLAYLCLEGRDGRFNTDVWPVIGALLAASAAVQLDRRERARRAEGDFLLSLLFAGDDFPEAELDRWARQLDIDLTTPARVTFLRRGPSSDSRRPLEQAQRLQEILTTTVGRPILASVRDGVVCLSADPVPQPARHWVQAWERIRPHLAEAGIGGVSVGGAFAGADGVRRSYRQARALAERQRNTARVLAAPGVAVYDEGGLTEIVLGHPDVENLQAYVGRVLGPLLNDPRFGGELAETLEAYLATGGSPAGAAELLHLHPSSVKYRIRVIRDLLGADALDDHDHRFELELALRMLRTFRELADTGQPRRTKTGTLSSRQADVGATTRP
ncbi:MAG: helix-turn-helix domain-containing protein [Actinomycetota bacterium]